jgi:hypothetical protein
MIKKDEHQHQIDITLDELETTPKEYMLMLICSAIGNKSK